MQAERSHGLASGARGVGAHPAPNSLRALLNDYAALRATGRPFAVASVVGVEGSAFRREGARLLIVPDPATDLARTSKVPQTWGQVPRPQVLGSISGGCLEGEVAWHALDCIRTGQARTVALTSRLGDDDRAAFGIGCGGTVSVLVQPVHPGEAGVLDAVAQALAARQSGALAVITGGMPENIGQHLFVDASGEATGPIQGISLRAALRSEALRTLAPARGRDVSIPTASGDVQARIEVIRPPVRLAVFGTGPDARALVRQAALLGWDTVAIGTSSAPEVAAALPEAHQALAIPEASGVAEVLDSRTAAVVMTHDFARDRALIAALSDAAVPYLGLLGSRRRTARLVADLSEKGATLPSGRLSSPVGLDLGAETPEEIALATCAEILRLSREWADESSRSRRTTVSSLS